MRYEIRNGKWGAYFYDMEVKMDMTLEMVLRRLNKNDHMQSQIDEIKTRLEHHASMIYDKDDSVCRAEPAKEVDEE